MADFERDGASFFARLSKRLTEERRKYAGPATYYYRCTRCGRTDAYVADVGRMMKLRCERPVSDPSESETGLQVRVADEARSQAASAAIARARTSAAMTRPSSQPQAGHRAVEVRFWHCGHTPGSKGRPKASWAPRWGFFSGEVIAAP